ncbi:hypothetical protein BEWA_048180 [Theileria equi strain WA]|uniref:Signal peptide containing protein n=1 Tax=Theileria equi strain WA TaxID=1537102 RepID=L1LAK8_THEEQ|nr:hypothetical protein BEWA_048180 [Theileria equi strain WA]EKX72351.1 hypothetical protein BEWA_048180 [Theileria equi strain WA]|eukprot:XP_004831803.1 hypothetical protein BEWA_048180 [Theileria equi strain WA]
MHVMASRLTPWELRSCKAGGCCGKRIYSSTNLTTLDISNPDKLKVHIDETTGNNRGKIFSPKNDQTVNKVVDGKATIWIAGAGEECSFVGLTLDHDRPKSVSLSIKKDSSSYIELKYYDKGTTGWNERRDEPKKRSTTHPASPLQSTR